MPFTISLKNKTGIQAIKQQQQASFEAERTRWEDAGQAEYVAEPDAPAGGDDVKILEGCKAATSSVAGSSWKLNVKIG